jgi:MoaA/NifB/PqqE/SkfB family radical SAM enzyme
MCGINSLNIPRNEYMFMEIETVKRIIQDIKKFWSRIRIEFAMCGEPTQHPEIIKIIRMFRKELPDAHLLFTSNGINFLNGKWDKWADDLKYCNILAVDLYEPYGEKLKTEMIKNLYGWEMHDYYDKNFNQHHYNSPKKGNHLVFIPDLISTARTKSTIQRKIFNHAGNSNLTPPLEQPKYLTCTFPFREMVIRYDGDISLCCLDFGSEYVTGNCLVNNLKDIWYGEKFNAARSFLRHKNRSFSPCCFCDAPAGIRSGIIPEYPEPDKNIKSVILNTMKNSKKLNFRESKFINIDSFNRGNFI